MRRATDVIAVMTEAQSISIHALLAESDVQIIVVIMYTLISIHALLAESDRSAHPETRQHDVISIHALLAESDAMSSQ